MKHFIKMAFYLLSIISIFGISSCEKELYEEQLKGNVKITIENVSLKNIELKSNILLMNRVNYVKEKFKKQQNKIVYDTITGLYFDDEKGLKINRENYESYTFNIISQNANEKLRNILFNKNSQGSFDCYIVKYDFTEDEMKNFTDEQQMQRKIQLKKVDENYSRAPFNDPCEDNWIEVSQSPRYFKVIAADDPCADDQGAGEGPITQSGEISGSNTSTNSTNNNGQNSGLDYNGTINNQGNNNNSGQNTYNGGGFGGGNASILTSPVILENDVDEIPCQNLNELSDPTAGNIKPNIDWLKDKVNDPTNDKEHGVSFKKSVVFDGSTQYVNTNISSPDKNSIDLPKGCKQIGGAHCHTSKGYSMYSFADVKWLRDAYDQACNGNKPNVVSMLVVKNEVTNVTEVFSITVNNIDQLNNYLDTTLNSSDFEGMSINEKIFKIQEKQAKNMENNKTNLLLNFVATFGSFGISVFKANDDTLENWSKIDVIPNPDSTAPENFILDLTPCN